MTAGNKIFKTLQLLKRFWKAIVIIIVPIAFLPLAISENQALRCGYVLCIVSIFWITEVLELAVTSLIPIVLFPVLGILTPSKVSNCYIKEVTFMMVGGMIVAKTIEKQNLHKRVALRILMFMGPNPIFQYFGFMFTTWFMSMWMSNTATTSMIIPLADALVKQLDDIENSSYINSQTCFINVNSQDDEISEIKLMTPNNVPSPSSKRLNVISKGLFLGIGYSAGVGGMATIFGSGTNMIFYGITDDRYGSRLNLNFVSYLLFALPTSIIIVGCAWIVVCIKYIGINAIFKRQQNSESCKTTEKAIREAYVKLGKMSYGEISTLIVFSIMVILWIIREPGVPLLGSLFIYKNKSGVNVKYWSDTVTAMLCALLVFSLPAKNPFTKTGSDEKLLNWKYLERNFAWSIVFLFGAGFAIAAAFQESGLSLIVGRYLMKLNHLPHIFIVLIVSFCISFLTEVSSNLATVTIILPIVYQMAECLRMHPMIMGLSTTFACSFSFCLPASNPPNAIVFSTGRLKVLDMASTGLILNILSVFVLTLMTYYLSGPTFQTNVFPEWLNSNCSSI